MKTLCRFKAFKLNKGQMHNVVGGAHCHITFVNEDGSKTFDTAEYGGSMNKDEAYEAIHNKYDGIWGAGNVIVNC